MLPHYSLMLFFPGGNPAAGASIDLSMDGSNVPPLLFTDSAATTPAANPMIAGPMGMIGFYAAPGLYLAELAGTFVRVPVDPAWPDPVIPDVYVHEQTVPSLTWTVDHHFGTDNPSVTITITDMQVETRIDHPTTEQTVLTFSTPVAGVATLRR